MPARSKKLPLSRGQKFLSVAKKPVVAVRNRVRNFQARRPHRSFRITRRRDYARSLKLPGYISFTHEVNKTLRKHRKTFIFLALFYAIASGFLVGIASQDLYTTLTDTLRLNGSEVFQGNIGQLGQTGVILLSIATTGLTENVTEVQQMYAAILALLVWLTTVWLLRNLIAGHRVKMRDGLYSAGAPIISTLLVSFVLVVQLIPVGIAAVGYAAATTSGILNGGVEAMLFWIAASLLVIVSLYLVTTTIFAMIIVTLPGMYPLRALRTAGDMVIGRRIRILLRFLWMGLCILVGWAIVMVPIILLDAWLKGMWEQIQWLPIIPITLLVVSTVTVIWAASYVYLLYRKVVDDDAKPA